MKHFVLPRILVLLAISIPLVAADAVDVDAEKAAGIIADEAGVTVLDLRTPDEYAEGHLEGAVNVDFLASTFEAELGKLDATKPYLVHCASGRRSGQAMAVFDRLKFAKIYHLNTGYKSWVAAGKPVVK